MKELLTLALTGILTMLAEMFDLRKLVFPLVLFGLAATTAWCIYDWGFNQRIYGMMKMENYALAFTAVMCVTTLLWMILSEDSIGKLAASTDRYALILFALTGAMVMVSFTNLVMLFLGIEILSVSLYVLAGSQKSDMSSNEAAFKYFLMGAFASGFLLFGIALIYGVTGSFDILQIRSVLAEQELSSLTTVGIIMILIGMGFKMSAAPFHFWAPDVYQGSPTPITAFMATVVKTAAIAATYHLFVNSFSVNKTAWSDVVVAMIVLTLLIGNISAVLQSDAKRMLAFSSISHAGYMLLALLSMNSASPNSILFYSVAYSAATIVGFMVLYLVQKAKGSTEVSAFKGLGKTNPLLAVAMTLAILSMAGIPPLAGFMAKYFIFANAISDGYLGLVLFAIAMSLVGVYYYFKIVIAMFLQEDTVRTDSFGEGGAVVSNDLQNILLVLGCGILLVLGVFPQLVSNLL
jgi:NADH-quinone oxidoreductase subunit N